MLMCGSATQQVNTGNSRRTQNFQQLVLWLALKHIKNKIACLLLKVLKLPRAVLLLH